MNKCFVKNSTGILKKVLLCPPNYMKLQPINVIAEKWIKQNNKLNIEQCIIEHKELIKLYEENGVEVALMEPNKNFTNEVFARDFGACIREGYILGDFKENIRKGETNAYSQKLKELGIPCVAKVTKGYFEGGDFWFLDDSTLAIGVVARTDEAAVEDIKRQISKFGYNVITVRCAKENLHLDMCFNVIEEKLVVGCKQALPNSFIDILKKRKFSFIDIPQEGVFKHYCNLQALGDGRVISLKSNVEVNKKLRNYGINVIEIELNEILKSGGGPHCMTFPLERI